MGESVANLRIDGQKAHPQRASCLQVRGERSDQVRGIEEEEEGRADELCEGRNEGVVSPFWDVSF